MENFKQIEIFDVWEHLRAGRNVIAVVCKSRNYTEGLRPLQKWTIHDLMELLKKIENGDEKNVIFYEEIEVE